ncbi:hypothetical protein I7I51_01241, partial [Histoplasma capsulatum]
SKIQMYTSCGYALSGYDVIHGLDRPSQPARTYLYRKPPPQSVLLQNTQNWSIMSVHSIGQHPLFAETTDAGSHLPFPLFLSDSGPRRASVPLRHSDPTSRPEAGNCSRSTTDWKTAAEGAGGDGMISHSIPESNRLFCVRRQEEISAYET